MNVIRRVLTTGQERRNKPESSAAKLYCLLRSKRGRARQREAERKRERRRERGRERGREGERQRAEEESRGKDEEKETKKRRDEERECQNPVPFKENYPPPRTCHSLIGCSPSAQLSSRERQNTWRENCPCTCADYVYHLEHSCQRHLIMANVRAAPNISPFSFNKSNRPPILMRVEIEVKSPVCR